MDMKTHHLLFILIALPLFCSCRSSRSMLREIQALKSSLYYELTSPIYQEKADQTVYLDFIDYSNMDYYTSVKRKKSAYIPLLLYNYEGELFHLRLGESSLTQLYREFLTGALLTECNSSTCCHLIDNQKGKMIPDSAYRLEVKIRKNETCARIKLNQSSIPWFEGEMLEVVNNKIRPADQRPAGRNKKQYVLFLHSIVHTHSRLSPLPGDGFFLQANPCRILSK